MTNKLHHVINGAEALDFLYCKGEFATRSAQEFPKLILLDLKMPKISGLQVLEKIKSDPNLKSIPVVMLTSSNEGGYRKVFCIRGKQLYRETGRQ